MVEFACPMCCGKSFKTREALKYHLTALIEFICCPECNQGFSSIVELVNHLDGLCSEDYHIQAIPDHEEEADMMTEGDEEPTRDKDSATSIVDSEDVVISTTVDHSVNDADNEENYVPAIDETTGKEDPVGAEEEGTPEIADDVQYYYCSSCECNIDSVIEHISAYHPNETVEYEGTELTMEPTVAVSDLVETIISEMVDDDETSHKEQYLSHAVDNLNPDGILTNKKQNLSPPNKSTKENLQNDDLPNTTQQLLRILTGNDNVREESSKDLKAKNKKRISWPQAAEENMIQNEDVAPAIQQTCEKCSREFHDMLLFKTHECVFSFDLKKECPVCSQKFPSASEFTTHFQVHLPSVKPLKVRTVGREFVRKMIIRSDLETIVDGVSCKRCAREFEDMRTFKLHKCIFSREIKKECPVCSETFETASDFTIHFREFHPTYKGQKLPYVPREFVRKMTNVPDTETLVEGYSCTKCSRDFIDEVTAKRHKCKVPEHLHRECPICFKKLETSRNYTIHLRKHGLGILDFPVESSGENAGPVHPYTCLQCNRGFDNNKYFEAHRCDPVKKRPEWICEVCGTKFSSKVGLNSHMRMHKPEEEKKSWKNKQRVGRALVQSDPVDESIFVCVQCGEEMAVEEKEAHVKTHQTTFFLCPLKSCNKNFASQELLDYHSQVHNEVQPLLTVYTCFYCRQKFGDQQQFLEHIVRHKTADRQHMCTHCGRGFQKPNERIKHEWIHTGNQPHVCLTCGMRFRKSFCLTTHQRIHTGSRPYTCEVCGKTFRTRSAFTHHTKIHSELRLFNCKMCPKTFKTAVQLCNHRNSHTKPFTCALCSRRFINSYSMRRHLRKHSTYQHFCEFCGAAYGRSFELRDHLIETHGRSKSPTPVKRKNKKQSADNEYEYDI